MDPVLQRLDQIEAKLDRVLLPPIIDLKEVMRLTGCRSDTAQHAWNHRHGLKAYERGKYRRLEVENKVAHLRLFPQPRLTAAAVP